MPEQPGTVILRLESRASTGMPDYKDSTLEKFLSANKLYNISIILICKKSAGYTMN